MTRSTFTIERARRDGTDLVDHFCSYASRIRLDSGDFCQIEPFQVEVMEPILRGVTEVWAVIPEGNAKSECVHTRLPTPDGWTTMLEVRPGDELLGSDGRAVLVTNVSEVKFGEDCYRVTFSDGASDVVSGDHLWPVEDAANHYRSAVRSTRYMYCRPLRLQKEGKSGRSFVGRWRVRNGYRVEGPDVELPLDPYVLGVWLGDGDSRGGAITNIDDGVWDELESRVPLNAPIKVAHNAATRRTIPGLVGDLRRQGLYGNKHIPEAFLVAPLHARWELLQGLMDTDGRVSKLGQATFCSTSRRLALDVRRLCWSLGLSAFLNETRAVLNGVDCGPSFLLTIACDQRHPVVRLRRKVDRLKVQARTADHRRIVSIERVQSVPVKCVAVDAPDRTYLTTDAYLCTHNTSLMAIAALYMCDYSRDPWIPIAASSRDQAEILAQQAYGMIRTSPGMSRRFKVQTGHRRILPIRDDHPGRGRGIKVMAADVGTGDGVIPYPLALCDEGHRWVSMALYRLWKQKLDKRGATVAMISTAGEPGSEFEQHKDAIIDGARDRRVRGAHIRYEVPGVVMNEWKVRDPARVTDMRAVKEANPLRQITVAKLRAVFDSPTTDRGDWARFKCNIPARSSGAAVSEQEWQDAEDVGAEIPAGSGVDFGLDVAWQHDTTAAVPLWLPGDGSMLLGDATIITPPRDGSMLKPDEVKAALEEDLLDPYMVETVVMDMSRAEEIAAWLEDEHGVRVVHWPTGNAQAARDYEAFMRGLRGGVLRHTGHAGLRAHVMHAVARSLPGKRRRFDRPSQSRGRRKQDLRVIDALSAAAMVVSHASSESEVELAGDLTDYRIVSF